MNARFIVVEGLTGSGKSTVAHHLAADLGLERPELLWDEIRPAVASIENDPGMLDTRFALYVAAVLRLGRNVEGILATGRGVVVDSWVYRTLATHRALGSTSLWRAPSWLPRPDAAFFLEVAEDERARRISSRGRPSGYWKSRCEEFSAQILGHYREVAPDLIYVDSNRPLDNVLSEVKQLLPWSSTLS